MASMMELSAATTASTLYPVMNLMSSKAKMLDGSDMARIMVEPALFTGIIIYFLATSRGMSFIRDWSISNSERFMAGTLYCLLRNARRSSSLRKPSLVRLNPSLPPVAFCSPNACWSCS